MMLLLQRASRGDVPYITVDGRGHMALDYVLMLELLHWNRWIPLEIASRCAVYHSEQLAQSGNSSASSFS